MRNLFRRLEQLEERRSSDEDLVAFHAVHGNSLQMIGVFDSGVGGLTVHRALIN